MYPVGLGNKLYNLINSTNLFQLISEPTRGNNLLDLIITNSPIHYFDYGTLPPLPDLDHCTIYAKFQQFYSTSPNYSRTIWQYNQGNYEAMNNYLFEHLIADPNSNVNENTINTTDCLYNCMLSNIPCKKVTIRPKDKPWYTGHVRMLYKESIRAFKLKNKTNNPEHIASYKHKHHLAKNAFRNARSNYYNNISNQILDPDTTTKILATCQICV